MSSARRPLGLGPAATPPSSAPTSQRLLPAERVEQQQPILHGEHQAVAMAKGRRILGAGSTTYRAAPD
ncbi:hypothetical protein [Streptomyces sp. NPDC056883]|uniref:hypothetical protein n=1 Tax=Streptomyces sp. NPDC056883 TaxID=3345959 RepID=UPI0036C9EF31